MNENIDLTKILEGCEGIELWTSIWGTCIFTKIDITDIEVELQNRCHRLIKKNGRHLECVDGECIVFPSKEQRDWSKFVKPIKEGTPVMCSDDKLDWLLAFYKYYKDGMSYVYFMSDNSRKSYDYKYIIPFDKFNPNDIEGSLKYNIQK